MRFVDVVMRTLDIRTHFSAIQTSDDIVNGKPDPEIYLKAMAKIGIPAAECFVLEDSSSGSLAGKRAGAYVISVPTEHTRSQDFSFADYVASSLTDGANHIFHLTTPDALPKLPLRQRN